MLDSIAPLFQPLTHKQLDLLLVIYLLAITTEAMSGALAAGRRNMDIFGDNKLAERCASFVALTANSPGIRTEQPAGDQIKLPVHGHLCPKSTDFRDVICYFLLVKYRQWDFE